MRRRGVAWGLIAAMSVCLSSALFAATRLTPVVNVASPTFVTNAGDGSNRLFVLEQAGVIRVLRPGESTTTVFLDVRSKVLSGGERGLLGLVFHPLFGVNGRFFVYYTRSGDGTLAEYKVSSNPTVADPTERVLLTIPHPTNANHNGGMLAFGPGGYLYIGVGDGGSDNDPPNNAQNIDVLLGKILRIDVDRSDSAAGTPYSIPASNPFVGKPGRDEIFALGLRNPWRFTFDRETGQQWVGDVGQDAREEVDTPIVGGGNFGWRVYEGSACTNNDPALCRPGSDIAPIFDYSHQNGRCSLTGGYVYRGSRGTVPRGTYIYGDYCTGEIFAWDGRAQALLLRTNLSISSFGEDEQGELYVVDLRGSVSKIIASSCPASISPASATLRAAAGTGDITVTAASDCGWTAESNASWITITSGAIGTANGVVTYSVAAYAGHLPRRVGTITIAGQTFSVRQSR